MLQSGRIDARGGSRGVSRQPGDFSLIAEEQFIEVANMLKVSQNAVEYSKEELVEQLSPLVEGHRYARFIHSFVASPGETTRAADILKKLTVVDPRGSMFNLFRRIWHVPTANNKNGNELAWRSIWARSPS